MLSPCLTNTVRKEIPHHPNHQYHSPESAAVVERCRLEIMTITPFSSLFKNGGDRGDVVNKCSCDGCDGGGDVCRACLHFTGMME